MITRFDGKFRFLSNFYPCQITLANVTYPTLEHAYQAMKTLNPAERETVRRCSTPGQAKRAGRNLTLRSDWNKIKVEIMSDLITIKFRNPDLARKLRATYPKTLIEGNHWHDIFWGICLCPKCRSTKAQNHLGKILMAERDRHFGHTN